MRLFSPRARSITSSSPPSRIAETLPEEILAKMHAPAKPAYPVLAPSDLAQFDGFILGVPTRYGNFPAQWKAFWDATGQLWAQGALAGKFATVFTLLSAFLVTSSSAFVARTASGGCTCAGKLRGIYIV